MNILFDYCYQNFLVTQVIFQSLSKKTQKQLKNIKMDIADDITSTICITSFSKWIIPQVKKGDLSQKPHIWFYGPHMEGYEVILLLTLTYL